MHYLYPWHIIANFTIGINLSESSKKMIIFFFQENAFENTVYS